MTLRETLLFGGAQSVVVRRELPDVVALAGLIPLPGKLSYFTRSWLPKFFDQQLDSPWDSTCKRLERRADDSVAWLQVR